MTAHTVDILLCFDRRFLLGAAVTIRSISENACASARLRFHIFASGLRESDMQRLRATPARRAAHSTVTFHQVDVAAFEGLLRSKNVTRAAYARLLAPEQLPGSIRRLVYVDVDVLFLRDICELLELDLQGKLIAAVPNGTVQDQLKNLKRIGVRAPSYFASGLMVIDLHSWRAQRVGQRALAFARDLGDRLILHDQDALNGVICGDYIRLKDVWCHWATHGRPSNDSVIHYAMSPKPWHADYRGGFREEFFGCLDRTAFAAWRPPSWFGLAPLAASIRRKLPYLPTAVRVLTRCIAHRRGSATS